MILSRMDVLTVTAPKTEEARLVAAFAELGIPWAQSPTQLGGPGGLVDGVCLRVASPQRRSIKAAIAALRALQDAGVPVHYDLVEGHH